ncbi:MAG: hypothetical protein K2H03_03515, partial [Muribaculaceae bacterium]|nr:hypothetical protein [Muribaculaceae bacterium]
MNATTRLYVALLLLVTLAIPGTHAEIHHSDFETIPGKYPGNKPDTGWLHFITEDGWEAYSSRFISLEKFELDSTPDDLNYTVLAICNAGTIESPLLPNGISDLSFHYAHY